MQRRFVGISMILIVVALLLATPRDGQSECYRMYKRACTEYGYTKGELPYALLRM